MELWFIYALLSTLGGGFFTFTQRIAAKRNYDTSLFSAVAAAVASIFGFTVAFAVDGLLGWSWLLLGYAVLNGFFYALGSITRMESLRFMDATLFFPLFKLLAPFFVVISGLIFFAESLSTAEWIGVTLSLLVPLLLISNVERTRQENLLKGLLFLLFCSFFIAISASFGKQGAIVVTHLFLFAALTNFFSFISSLGIYFYKHRATTTTTAERLRALRGPQLSLVLLSGFFQFFGIFMITLAFAEGPLSLAYTINSLYILIPIVLSIIFYNEHWNLRKALAIILSIAALGFIH